MNINFTFYIAETGATLPEKHAVNHKYHKVNIKIRSKINVCMWLSISALTDVPYHTAESCRVSSGSDLSTFLDL